MVRILWWGVLSLLALAACAPTGPAVEATPDLANRYTHPGGVFSLRLPPGWSAGDLSDGAALLVTFGPPGAVNPPLTVYSVRLAEALDPAGLRAALDAYLAADYNASLTVLDRDIMSDGSWRVRGVRQRADEARPVNLFVQADGAYFSALEVVVPANDAYNTALLQLIVNSYRVAEMVEWPVGAVEAVPLPPPEFIAASGNLMFAGLRPWTDDLDRFHISGRIANRAPYAVQGVQVRAALLDEAGNIVAEQFGAVPADVLLDSAFAPFEVRFDGGRPPAAVRYTLQAEAQLADDLAVYYGPAAFDWEDRAEYDEAGTLHIRGTLWNTGEAAAGQVEAIITFFDGADRVVGYVSGMVGEGTLAAGDSARFDISVPYLAIEPARYLLTIQAQRQ